ncbi:MAG: amidase family protein, partial [Pseudomonadales bacterium]
MDTDEEITLWPTTRQAQAIKSGEITSRQLLEAFAARIERINPQLNAVVTLDLDAARAAADEADAAVARGVQLGALHGVPVTIQDALETA